MYRKIIYLLLIVSTCLSMQEETPSRPKSQEVDHHTVVINIDGGHAVIDVDAAQKLDTEYIETIKPDEEGCKKRSCQQDRVKLAIIGGITTVLTAGIGGIVTLIVHFTR